MASKTKSQSAYKMTKAANNAKCSFCGSTLTSEQGKRSVVCTHCGHHQELGEDIAEVIHYHEALVEEQLSKANAIVDLSEIFAKDYKRLQVNRLPLLKFLENGAFIIVPSLLVMLMLAIASVTGAVSIEAARIPFRIFSATLCIPLLLLYLYYGYRPEKNRLISNSAKFDTSVILGCDSCGARNQFKLRRVLTHCRYCGATLYLNVEAILKGMEAARLLRRKSKQAFARNKRSRPIRNSID